MTSQFTFGDITSYVTIPECCNILAYRGSIAHGMFVPSTDPNSIDDIDLMGVMLGSVTNYLGLHEWGSRGTKEIKEGKWDVVLYEIRKMVTLLLQGNPNVLSLLWNKSYIHLDEHGKKLVAAKNLFVGKHVYNAFAGYAYQQMEKMESRDPAELREYLAVTAEMKYRGIHPNQRGICGPAPDVSEGEAKNVHEWSDQKLQMRLAHFQKKGENIGYLGDKRKHLVLEHGFDRKNAAHLIRLLRMCKEFMQTGELVVYRPDAEELLAIKTGKDPYWTLEKVKEHAKDLFQECKDARDASTLPQEPDRIRAEKLLEEILWDHLSQVTQGKPIG